MPMRRAIATVLVAFAVVLAGCPGTDGGSGGDVAGDEQATETIDNDAGAEPINPENGTAANGTDDGFAGLTATANGTATPGPGDG